MVSDDRDDDVDDDAPDTNAAIAADLTCGEAPRLLDELDNEDVFDVTLGVDVGVFVLRFL